MFSAYLINTKRVLLFGLFALSFALSLTISFGSSSANAQSIYDDWYSTVDTLYLGREDYGSGFNDCELEDYSTDWSSLISEYGSIDALDSFNYAIQNDLHWGVINRVHPSPFDGNGHNYSIQIIWSHDPNHEIDLTIGSTRYIYSLTIHYGGGNCNPSFVYTEPTDSPTSLTVDPYDHYIFFLNFPLVYPDGYEGEIIPDSYAPPIEYEQTPDWYVSEAIDWKVQIHDSNFNTFDEIEWTCNEGLAPVLYYEIWSVDDNVKLIDGYHNATAQIDWQAPEVDELRIYEVRGKYFCGDLPDDPQFPHFSTRQFAISEHGMLDFTPFYQCMTDEAPYVDFEACIASFERFINQLSFGAIGYSNNWSYQAECHHLGILGDWINAPNASRQVCPQFPAQVRNIITPFVTFLLGLMTITFIASRGEHGSRKDDI